MKKALALISILAVFLFFTPSPFTPVKTANAAAIAFLTSGSSAGGGSPQSMTIDPTGTNSLLLVTVATGGEGATTDACTFNGVSMTQVSSHHNSDTSGIAMFAAVGAAGSHSVSCTFVSTFGIVLAAAYSGVNQSTTPDQVTWQDITASPDTTSLTSVPANSWGFLSVLSQNAAPTPGTGTGSPLRQAGTNPLGDFADTNAVVSGSVSMQITGAATSFATIMASYTAAASAAATVAFWQMSDW